MWGSRAIPNIWLPTRSRANIPKRMSFMTTMQHTMQQYSKGRMGLLHMGIWVWEGKGGICRHWYPFLALHIDPIAYLCITVDLYCETLHLKSLSSFQTMVAIPHYTLYMEYCNIALYFWKNMACRYVFKGKQHYVFMYHPLRGIVL